MMSTKGAALINLVADETPNYSKRPIKLKSNRSVDCVDRIISRSLKIPKSRAHCVSLEKTGRYFGKTMEVKANANSEGRRGFSRVAEICSSSTLSLLQAEKKNRTKTPKSIWL